MHATLMLQPALHQQQWNMPTPQSAGVVMRPACPPSSCRSSPSLWRTPSRWPAASAARSASRSPAPWRHTERAEASARLVPCLLHRLRAMVTHAPAPLSACCLFTAWQRSERARMPAQRATYPLHACAMLPQMMGPRGPPVPSPGRGARHRQLSGARAGWRLGRGDRVWTPLPCLPPAGRPGLAAGLARHHRGSALQAGQEL